MRKVLLRKFIPVMIFSSFLVADYVTTVDTGFASDQVAAASQEAPKNVYKGKVVGKSNKAKSISISVGKGDQAKTIMVKFNDETTGIEHAEKGEAAIIEYKVVGNDKIATAIKPKLAELPKGVSEVQPEYVADLIAKGGNYMLIDSRPGKRFDAGSIPSAVSIPVPKIKKDPLAVLPDDKNTELIFFCGGPTWGMSTESAGLAVKNGYTNVKVMLKGVPGWKKAGKSVVASDDFIKNGNIVLVDLRSADEYKKGHIPRAYSIPMAELEDAEDDFPSNLTAPVVVYGNEAEQAYKMVKGWGYKTASVAAGGVDAWVAAGNSLDTSPSPEEIVWVRKLEKGEVSLADFNTVAEENPANAIILDVRTNDEAAEGKFEHAVHIPLDELGTKLDTLPKDKEILVHCTTGARAEMAYQELVKAGFNAKYLVANVECDEDGCEAEE